MTPDVLSLPPASVMSTIHKADSCVQKAVVVVVSINNYYELINCQFKFYKMDEIGHLYFFRRAINSFQFFWRVIFARVLILTYSDG